MSPYFPHRGSPEKRAQPTQGKLFQEGKPAEEHRYPRGYTPQRMKEVRRATIGKFDASPSLFPVSYSPTGATLDSPYNVAHGPRLAREAIARSDIPVKHLEGISRISLQHGMRPGNMTLGSYAPSQRSIDIEPLKGDLSTPRGLMTSPEQERKRQGVTRQRAQPIYDAALVHEIGHHADFAKRFPKGMNEEEVQKEIIDKPTGRGRAEGAADKYQLDRFKNDPRNQRQTKFDPETQTYGAKGINYKGYPKALTQRGEETAVRTHTAGVAIERTNLNRKAAAQQTRKALTRYRQSQARRKKR
jgi:hypothetical protein